MAIDAEGAGPEVARIGDVGRRRGGFAAAGGILLVVLVLGIDALAVGVLFGDGLEALAVESGFHGEDGVEAPFTSGDAQDQLLFGFSDGLEAIDEVLEEEQEVVGIVIEDDVFVGAEAVDQAIAAGFVFAFGGAGTGGFLCVTAIGFYFGLAGWMRWLIHGAVPFASML